MPFWTLSRKVVAAVSVMVALTFGWAAVVVAVALASAHDEARSADAIAVLGAAQYNGRPSPVFRARLDHAAALYQRGLAPVILVTGGVGSGSPCGSEAHGTIAAAPGWRMISNSPVEPSGNRTVSTSTRTTRPV